MNNHSQTSTVSTDISDNDVLEAMRSIPGYLDITVEDFRSLYILASNQALKRAFAHVRAGTLMRKDVHPVTPDAMLSQAAQSMAEQKLKALPVVNNAMLVLGMLTETDFLRRLHATGFMDLMLQLIANPNTLGHNCHETPVSSAMSTPVVSVSEDAGFADIVAAFQRCPGRSLPVVDLNGKLRGILLRKQFVAACHIAGPF